MILKNLLFYRSSINKEMKKPRIFLYFLLILSLSGCKSKEVPSIQSKDSITNLPIDESKVLTTIALGSCNKSHKTQRLWNPILENNPDLWIWLGDIIYADTKDMQKMRADYDRQNQNPNYRKLRKQVPIIGIWDDHDYGVNDGDKNYSKRVESRNELFRFLEVDSSSPAWKRSGAYQSYTFGEKGKKVKILLLDARYFRDPLEKNIISKERYKQNKTGTILGKEQWAWLEEELKNSDANVHILASGIQVLPTEHPFEKWNLFPQERTRLLKLIQKLEVPGVVFVSGDRHIGELMKLEEKGMNYPVYELTTSGLTHSYEKVDEANTLRIGEVTGQLNFGIIKIDWSAPTPALTFEIRGESNNMLVKHHASF